jgi:hypothetical protein
MGFYENVWAFVRGHAERLGGQNKLRKDLLRNAFNLDLPIHDLDEDAAEDGSVEHLAQTGIGLLVGRARLAQQR